MNCGLYAFCSTLRTSREIKTTRSAKEEKTMKQLKFEHIYAQDIVAGEKQATLRVHDDKNIHIGDHIEIVDKVDPDHPTKWQVPGKLVITGANQLKISELDSEQLKHTEHFASVDEMIQTFRRFYGDHISDKTMVSMFDFDYVAYDEPRQYLEQKVFDDTLNIAKAKLYADGGSRGNPGPSALGFVVLDSDDNLLHSDNKYLGITTNNQAEYHAALAGMEWCLKHSITELEVYLDSMLVVNQLKGIFKVKNRDLWSLYESAKQASEKFKTITFTHVPRELNKAADAEVNKALDAVKGDDIVQ